MLVRFAAAGRGARLDRRRDVPQIGQYLSSVLVPLLHLLVERLHDDALEQWRHAGIQPGDRFGLAVNDAIQRLRHRSASERQSSGQQLVHHDARGEDVRAHVHRATNCLLWTHVVDGADDDAFGRVDVCGSAGWLGTDALGEPEVQNLDAPARGQHHVRALQVAMHDALAVGFLERVEELKRDVDHIAGTERSVRDTVAERLAFHVLHGDEADLAGVANLEDLRDVGMRQRRCEPRFAQKALAAFLVHRRRARSRQQLERHAALQDRILGQMDVAHPTAAEQRDKAITFDVRRCHAPEGSSRWILSQKLVRALRVD